MDPKSSTWGIKRLEPSIASGTTSDTVRVHVAASIVGLYYSDGQAYLSYDGCGMIVFNAAIGQPMAMTISAGWKSFSVL